MVLSIKIYDKEESVKSFVLGLGLSIMVACFFEIGRLFSYAEPYFPTQRIKSKLNVAEYQHFALKRKITRDKLGTRKSL